MVNGFVKDVLQQLPMEFAVEAQKLISVSLEGSVGIGHQTPAASCRGRAARPPSMDDGLRNA